MTTVTLSLGGIFFLLSSYWLIEDKRMRRKTGLIPEKDGINTLTLIVYLGFLTVLGCLVIISNQLDILISYE